MKILSFYLVALPLAITLHASAQAAGKPERSWAEEKCIRYEKAFGELLAVVGPSVTEAFIKGNRDFIAAGCSNGADVCPSSPKDFELANGLTIAAMGFGTASSFLPFVCRQP